MVSQTQVRRLKWLIALQKCSAEVTCRMTYRRTEEIAFTGNNEPSSAVPDIIDTSGQRNELKRQDMSLEDKIEDYTRVRIWTRAAGPVSGSCFIPSTLNPIRRKMPYANRQFFQVPTGLTYTPAITGHGPFLPAHAEGLH